MTEETKDKIVNIAAWVLSPVWIPVFIVMFIFAMIVTIIREPND
jgi:heme/copper-type cytochrome/quinol oxidase subunit 2